MKLKNEDKNQILYFWIATSLTLLAMTEVGIDRRAGKSACNDEKL